MGALITLSIMTFNITTLNITLKYLIDFSKHFMLSVVLSLKISQCLIKFYVLRWSIVNGPMTLSQTTLSIMALSIMALSQISLSVVNSGFLMK
jgi:hypothetical protein